MRKIIAISVSIASVILLTASVFLPQQASAQAPQKMSYQAVVRDASNNLVSSQSVGIKITILQNTTPVYIETQSPTTNDNGLASIEIGAGTVVSGDLTTIDWANYTYFIKTEIDPSNAGGTNYSITGTSQLLSVPYALHAKTAETVPETDPVYTGSEAANITNTDITNLSNLSGTNTGNQNISGIANNTQAMQDTAAQIRSDIPDVSVFITSETDPVYTGSEAANITTTDITNLSNLSGTNTGDQNISGIANNTQAIQDTAAQIRSNIPDVSGFITSETDPVYSGSQAANITAADIANLSNLSGTNTGDQNISGIANNTQAIQDTAAQIHSDIPDVSVFITSETDPVFSSSTAAGITGTDITNWNNVEQKWSLTGNSATTASHFIGSPDDNPLIFRTNNIERLRINANGIVSLPESTGSANKYEFHVNGGRINFSSAQNDVNHTIYNNGTNIDGEGAWDGMKMNVFNGLNIRVGNGGTTSALYINSSANIGIGTTTPGAKLDVNGDITATGLNINGDITATGGNSVNWNNAFGWGNHFGLYRPIAWVPAWADLTGKPTLSIGQSYQGGIIFWLDESGQHGLIAATADQSPGVKWNNGSNIIINTIRNGIYAGDFNTELIFAIQGEGNYAATICANYNGGNYCDWYLPSQYELFLLFTQRNVVGGFVYSLYWSSNEVDDMCAETHHMIIGGTGTIPKSYVYPVRAIRAF